jgi:hypothetical protein
MFNSYCAVNTRHLGYKNQSANAMEGKNNYFFKSIQIM